MLVLGIEPQHFAERIERAIDEAAAFVVEPEAQQHVRVFDAAQFLPLEQRLVNRDDALPTCPFSR